MAKRFFAFGCSYTDYCWATWADGMCYDLNLQDWETYNYGNSGMGNQHILNSLVMADLKHEFTDDDVICVLWSSWIREDMLFKNNQPQLGPQFSKTGSILGTNHSQYKSFADQFFVFENYILNNVTAIIAANRAFNISYQAHILHNEEYSDTDPSDELLNSFVTFKPKNKFYDNTDKEYYTELNICKASTPIMNDPAIDGHPNPMMHYQFLKYKVYPALGWEPSDKLFYWMQQQNKLLRTYDKDTAKTHQYKEEIEPIKRKDLYNMKDWRDLWSATRDYGSGSPEKGILEMLDRAKPKMY